MRRLGVRDFQRLDGVILADSRLLEDAHFLRRQQPQLVPVQRPRSGIVRAQLRELLRAAAAYAAGGREALLRLSKAGGGAATLIGQMK